MYAADYFIFWEIIISAVLNMRSVNVLMLKQVNCIRLLLSINRIREGNVRFNGIQYWFIINWKLCNVCEQLV